MRKRKPRQIQRRRRNLPPCRSTRNFLALMPVTGYMKFNLTAAGDSELFTQTVEATGDFATPSGRAVVLGSPHSYKFTVTLCNRDGVLLNEYEYHVPELIDHTGLDQIITQFTNEQANEVGVSAVCGHHSTIKVSVFNPNTKEHL